MSIRVWNFVLLHCLRVITTCKHHGGKLPLDFYEKTCLPLGILPGVSFWEESSLCYSHLGTSQSVVSGRPMLWGCLSLSTRWLWRRKGISRCSTFGWIYFSVQLFQPCHHIWAVNLSWASSCLGGHTQGWAPAKSGILLAEEWCVLEGPALPALPYVTAELAVRKGRDLIVLTAS